MAYDSTLAERVRDLVYGRAGVREKAMFGGLAFLLDGRMFCGVLGEELLARVGPDGHDAAMAREHVRVMDFTGRPMRGYVFAGPGAVSTRADLARWVDECARFAATLKGAPAARRKRSGRAAARSAVPARSTRAAPRRARGDRDPRRRT